MSPWSSNTREPGLMRSRVSDFYRTAFVTGSSTGLGLAFSEMLLEDGVLVWGTARDPGRLRALADRPAGGFTPVTLELTDGAAAAAAFHAADVAAGGFDVVINNAGFGIFAEFAAVDFSHWHDQLEAMLINTARLSHAALQGMRSRDRGALVNISSLAAEFPLPFQSAYNMAKAGLTALSESLIIELRDSGIVILDVRPGDYRTDLEGSVRRPQTGATPAMARAWAAFADLMRSGPAPQHAAVALRTALLRRRSGTVRTGRFFQAVMAPFLARFGSLPLRRRIQAHYHNIPW
jgi:NAD(P)-dependent dehydrogenase (short-subunit alcohol dehydrogenase family)